ncbi:hypothetical protein ANN_05808 [Periplaneta americana]|uniref:Uncharacterized protein n=1 Tax=Periplaneta americana TaxID=6978 RepID=A0ABQ8TDM4_PERAM|nr:hypothetical protein ANN_05808 [Periplaneta americana]
MEDNIKMDLREVGYDGRDWINLAQDRDQWRAYVRAAMNLRAKPSTRSSYLLAWSPNSPDLTPPDFFVWGFVKDIVYSQKPRNIDDLRVKITQAFQQITPLMLQETLAELHHRYELCRVRNGVKCSVFKQNDVEEISCLAENGSTRPVDILAYNADTKQGIIVDPTKCFEVECHQSAEVHLEKKSIYEPTVNYFKLKYALIHVEDALEGVVNGRRVRGRRRYQMIDNIKLFGSHAETKKKEENRKDRRMMSLQ